MTLQQPQSHGEQISQQQPTQQQTQYRQGTQTEQTQQGQHGIYQQPQQSQTHQQPQQVQQPQMQQRGQQSQVGQQMLTQQPQSEGTIEQSLPQEMQQALYQFNEAAKVCEWCAERCADDGPQMAACLRLCRDVADIASLNARFIARDSPYGPALAREFIDVAQACAQECAQHSHGHCQDCANVLGQAIQTTQQLLQSLPSMGSQQMQSQQRGQQRQFQQPGQPMGTQSSGHSLQSQ